MRFLKIQALVLLFGGIAGPLMIVFSVAMNVMTGGTPLSSPNFYIGAFITVADVVIAICLVMVWPEPVVLPSLMKQFQALPGMFKQLEALPTAFNQAAARPPLIEQRAVLTLAAITGFEETGLRINDRQMVNVNLHITIPGLEPFDSEDRIIVDVTRMVHLTARKLVVLVDPATRQHQIDWERSDLVNGLMPAKFTSEADNQTYDLTGQAGPLMEILQILHTNHIPFNRMVDVRSNPVLREQVQAVIRRTAEAQSTSAPAPGAAKPAASIGNRLAELEPLHTSGAVTEEEYMHRRAQIIAEI